MNNLTVEGGRSLCVYAIYFNVRHREELQDKRTRSRVPVSLAAE
jgi:hypothetical protein